MSRETCLTLDEVRDIVHYDDGYSGATIAVLPPNINELSDDDDDINVVDVMDVEMDVTGNLEIDISQDDEQDDQQDIIDDQQPSTSSGPTLKSSITMTYAHVQPSYAKIKKPDFPKTSGLNGGAAITLEQTLKQTLRELSPVELFEQFFSSEVYDLISKETVRYATTINNDQEFFTSAEEIKVFLGILMLTGYHQLPTETDYWSDAEDLAVPIVKNAMSRNRFQKLKANIHFVDNDTAAEHIGDRLFKIKPLFELLNSNFRKFGYFKPNLSIDEMIVRYYGRNSLKQYLKEKPFRFGYKYWALCSSDGYCFSFTLYCGKENAAETKAPLGLRVVLNEVSHIEDPSSYVLYFDEFFTSMELLLQLANSGFRATGAINEQRISKNCPLEYPKMMVKKLRGSLDYAYNRTSETLLVRWHGNKIVTMATNHDSIQPYHDVKRRIKGQEEEATLKMPNVIRNYNDGIGGVDRHDWLVSKYAVAAQGKKWYWPLFTRSIDMAIVNAWLLHKLIREENALTLKDFRRAVATVYLKIVIARRFRGRPRVALLPKGAEGVRYDGVGHFLNQRDKQRRCQREGCEGKPKTFCGKCDKTLCRTCFQPYHCIQ